MNQLVKSIDTLLYHARKGVQYEHHKAFLSICIHNKVIPKGLRVRKRACIHDGSEEFQRKWEEEEEKGGQEFTRLLEKENSRKAIKHQTIFWDLTIDIMANSSV